MNERTTKRRLAAVTATTTATIAVAALLATAQTPTTQPANAPSGDASGAPANAPTTQQAAYDRLLGGDENRSEKPILPAGKPAAIDRTTGAAAVAPGAPQLQVYREGSYIVNQTGRLARSRDGDGYEFVFNADGTSLRDPPMKVLANLKLERMQDELESQQRDLRFRITGMVTEYRGRNHILLEKVVILSDVK